MEKKKLWMKALAFMGCDERLIKEINIVVIKGRLVRRYIGEAIAPYGFKYSGFDCGSWNWEFKRKCGKITQTISIVPYRFNNHMISFELYTTARETGIVQAHNIGGIEADNYQYGYWRYGDSEESMIKTLEQINEVLIEKGMKNLERLGVSPKKIADNQMVRNIYYKHRALSKKFVQENGIEVTGFDPENIERWFAVIEERVKILQQGTVEDAKEELTEMAAFLGVQLVKYMGGKWKHFVNGDFESCSVQNLKSEVTSSNCLNLLLGGYSGNGMQWTKRAFLKIYEKRTI